MLHQSLTLSSAQKCFFKGKNKNRSFGKRIFLKYTQRTHQNWKEPATNWKVLAICDKHKVVVLKKTFKNKTKQNRKRRIEGNRLFLKEEM